MSRSFITIGLLAAPIAFQFITYKPAIATGPVASFLDTGTDEIEEIDPLSVWPNKILVDAQANIILMVWFDKEGIRHTKIPFGDVNYLKKIPRHGSKRAELHIALKDGRIFLGAADAQSINQQAILLQGTLGKKIKKGGQIDLRIIPVDLAGRASPKLVLGKHDGADAFKPPSKRSLDMPMPDQEEDELSIGEELDQEAKGVASKKDVNSVIKRNMGRFRSCYQKSLKKNPDLSGKIVVRFAIGIDGKVNGAKIKETEMKSPEVERCILKHFYSLRFDPPSEGKALINYPINFSNQSFQ